MAIPGSVNMCHMLRLQACGCALLHAWHSCSGLLFLGCMYPFLQIQLQQSAKCVQVFVLGGSWSGPKELPKDAELYDPTAGTWSSLPGIQASYILTDDPEDAEEGRVYRADNYGMFHSWSDGTGAFLVSVFI